MLHKRSALYLTYLGNKLYFTMSHKILCKIHNVLYVARDVIHTFFHNVAQCLQNVKHNVVQAILDNVTLNFARSVIQCRTNDVHYIVHSTVQPMVHNGCARCEQNSQCVTLHTTLCKLFITMLCSVCKTLNTMLYKPL